MSYQIYTIENNVAVEQINGHNDIIIGRELTVFLSTRLTKPVYLMFQSDGLWIGAKYENGNLTDSQYDVLASYVIDWMEGK
jgi:hypothetical protein